MERTAKGLRTCLFVLQYVAVFAAGVPVAGLRKASRSRTEFVKPPLPRIFHYRTESVLLPLHQTCQKQLAGT
ncbi:hypothetical protein MRX96_010996 [Rhipicephalus microplus]